jgi:hypothetical protein
VALKTKARLFPYDQFADPGCTRHSGENPSGKMRNRP